MVQDALAKQGIESSARKSRFHPCIKMVGNYSVRVRLYGTRVPSEVVVESEAQ
jgi:ribosomal protein L9